MSAKDISKTMVLKDGVTPTLRKVQDGTVKLKKDMQDLKTVANSAWSSIKVGAGAAVAAVGAAATAAAGIGIKVNASAEMAEKSFGILLKSTEDAKKMVSDLQKLGLESPFEFAGLQNAAKTLLGMGYEGKQVIPMLYSLGDAVAAVGGNTEQMEGIALAIGQIQSKGKISAEEMNQLAERGIPAWGLLSKQMGKSTAELMKMSENGQLFANEAIPALMKGLNERFNGSMRAMSDTWNYTIANMKETAAMGLAGVTKPLFNEIKQDLQGLQERMSGDELNIWGARFSTALVNIYSGVKSVGGAVLTVSNFIVNHWGIIGPIVYGVTAGFVAYKTALIGVRAWTLAVTAATWLQAKAQLGLNAAIRANPIGFIITLLGLLVMAGTYVIQNWEQVKLVGMNTWNTLVDAAQWGVNLHVSFANILYRGFAWVWDGIKYAGGSVWNYLVKNAEDGINRHIKIGNTLIKTFKFVWEAIKYSGMTLWDGVVSAAEAGLKLLLKPANMIREALGKDKIEVDFGSFKSGAKVPKWDDFTDVIPSVDFGAAKVAVEAPKWDSQLTVAPPVDFSRAKFGDDSIMEQTRKAQEERDKKKQKSEDKLAEALSANTAAMEGNTAATGDNTSATKENTGKLKDNGSPMDIADSLFGRIERHIWST